MKISSLAQDSQKRKYATAMVFKGADKGFSNLLEKNLVAQNLRSETKAMGPARREGTPPYSWILA